MKPVLILNCSSEGKKLKFKIHEKSLNGLNQSLVKIIPLAIQSLSATNEKWPHMKCPFNTNKLTKNVTFHVPLKRLY